MLVGWFGLRFSIVCLFVWLFLDALLDVETERDLAWRFNCSRFSSISALLLPQ